MASPTITPSERIHELGEINETLSNALKDAGLAVRTLSNGPPTNREVQNEGSGEALGAKKEDFEQNVKAYYTGVQAAIAKLRRQAYALEEAGVISAEAPAFTTIPQQRQQANSIASDRASAQTAGTQDTGRVTNGGLGNLDIGWLNSRGNKVSAEKEAELVKEAVTLLEGVTAQAVQPVEGT